MRRRASRTSTSTKTVASIELIMTIAEDMNSPSMESGDCDTVDRDQKLQGGTPE